MGVTTGFFDEDIRQHAADLCAIEMLITATMFNAAEYLPHPITNIGARICGEINRFNTQNLKELSEKSFDQNFNQYVRQHEKYFVNAAKRIKKFRTIHRQAICARHRPSLTARAPGVRKRRYTYASDPGHLAALFQLLPVWETTRRALWNRTEGQIIADIRKHVRIAAQAAKLMFCGLTQAFPEWYSPYLEQTPSFDLSDDP